MRREQAIERDRCQRRRCVGDGVNPVFAREQFRIVQPDDAGADVQIRPSGASGVQDDDLVAGRLSWTCSGSAAFLAP